jgi:hypothetical protein
VYLLRNAVISIRSGISTRKSQSIQSSDDQDNDDVEMVLVHQASEQALKLPQLLGEACGELLAAALQDRGGKHPLGRDLVVLRHL